MCQVCLPNPTIPYSYRFRDLALVSKCDLKSLYVKEKKAPGQKSVISPRSENYSGLKQYLGIYITLKVSSPQVYTGVVHHIKL